MSVQVLVAAMDQNDHSLLDTMNIQSDVIVGNQCDRNSVEEFEYQGHKAVYLNFAERGVGLNRNNALMRATGDYCLFADDDMVYVADYPQIVEEAFEKNPSADVIVFNLSEKNGSRKQITKKGRVTRLNYLRYGAARIAVRLRSVKSNGIYFNQCFGGGTEHCHGEDNLFLTACMDKGLKIVALPVTIAELTDKRESTWYKGYDEKYLRDQGILFRTMFRKSWFLWCMQDAFRRYRSYGMSPFRALRIMKRSAKLDFMKR